MDDDLVASLSRHCDVFRQLSDREPVNSTEAQAVIENIRAEKGHLDDELLEELNTLGPRSKERLLRIVNLKRVTEAEYTTNISEQLYSSKSRFLYELIQNADNSSYENCRRGTIQPYLRFRVTDDAFILETNEDGFKRANIEAICATGKSSENMTGTDDQMGEKGFGFKSVFAIANEVQVQSGLWSFRFRHRKGEDGLGMVTPLDATPETLPADVTTRITLRYSDEAKQEYSRLLEAIHNLPDTTILFLQRLRSIHIEVTKSASQTEKISFSKRYCKTRTYCYTTCSKEINYTKSEEKYTYLLFGVTKADMPPHEHRPGRANAHITLAFPMDPATCRPKLSEMGQHVFAYLPIQRLAQIQFVIQSDFITSASRESIIDCSWNRALCESAASKFVEVVSTVFAQPDSPLRYSWLDFLPKSMIEQPWGLIYSSIITVLSSRPIVHTREHRLFKAPHQVRQLTHIDLHCGQPILPDMADEAYIASEYSAEQERRLRELGLRRISWDELIDRLQADLARATSRTKNKPAADPWHKALAKMFLFLFRSQGKSDIVSQKRLKTMAIIPLIGVNQWTGTPVGSNFPNVYFACTDQIPIPESVPLRILNKYASRNGIRRAFYRYLGVEECPKELVFAEIRRLHSLPRHPLAKERFAELQYLFHFHENPSQLKDWVMIPTSGDGTSAEKTSKSWYFPSQEKYDMNQLIPLMKREEVRDVMTFMPTYLVEFVPLSVIVRNKTWKTWLKDLTNAETCPRLTQKINNTTSLSSEMLAVLRYSPFKFLATLNTHRTVYQDAIDLVHDELSDCEVPCMGGTFVPLCETYLPTTDILRTLSEFGLPTTTVDILQLHGTVLTDVVRQECRFLKHFGVRLVPDLNFFLIILHCLTEKENVSLNIVKQVYMSISDHARTKDFDTLRTFFAAYKFIYYPPEQWETIKECVWRGPSFFSYIPVLSRVYGTDPELERFFTLTLNIQEVGFYDVVKEMDMWGSYGEKEDLSTDKAVEFYTYLSETVHNPDDWMTLRTEFDTNLLVLGADKLWYPLKECLWNSPFPLAGYVDVAAIYPTLETFFVENMGVKKVTLSMLIQEVDMMAHEETPSIKNVRKGLIEVGTLLATSTMDNDVAAALTNLQSASFLPKKTQGGVCVLVGVTDDFAIPDHSRYADALRDSGALLDFGVSEVQCLHGVFEYMGLTKRYLSNIMKEVSSVGGICVEECRLSRLLRAKAYALYCCAAKYKSNKALRGDRTLYEQLCQATIHTTDKISTNLVLSVGADTISVPSDRELIHHDIHNGKLKIYVPKDERKRRACYRSQLPDLLTSILSVSSNATFNVSSIITSTLRDLDEVLREQDIPSVDWIRKPVIGTQDYVEDERPLSPASVTSNDDMTTLVGRMSRLATPTPHGRTVHVADADETKPPSQYLDFIDQVVRSAQRAANRYLDARTATPPHDDKVCHFDYQETFGNRNRDPTAHDRRIGAAGEAYIYELLTTLQIPSFSEDNWRSTIRGDVSVSTRFANMKNWVGTETADIVYTDTTGELTKFLREKCEGAYLPHWNRSGEEVEYFIEVKSTVGACEKEFYLSGGQYKRMESMALEQNPQRSQIYVIIRVYDLITPDVKTKVFVDPVRFRGAGLEFEAQGWVVTAP